MPVERAVECFKDTLRGLEFAEKKQIIHCDIKPDNLMIAEENIIKIGDLGLAQSLDSKKEDEQLYGTPHYFAPERITGGIVDHRSDMYSCGATFYRILTGTTPFKGRNTKEIIKAHVNEPLKPPREVNPDIPSYLQDIIVKMMEKSPTKRYESNSVILEQLENAKRKSTSVSVPNVPTSLRRPSRIRSMEKQSPNQMRKTILTILHNVLPVIVPSLLFALGYYFFFSGNGTQSVDPDTETTDRSPTVAQSKEEKLAQQDYLAAMEKHKQQGDSAEVIAALKQVSETHRGTSYADKARDFLQRIYSQRKQKEEQKMYAMLQNAMKYEENNPYDYDECIQRYRRVVELYSDLNNKFIKDAQARIFRLQNAQKTTEKKREMAIAFLKHEKEIDTLIENKQLQEAWDMLDSIETDYMGFDDVTLRIKDKRTIINNLRREVLSNLEQKASALIDSKKYKEAVEVMKEMLQIKTADAKNKYNALAIKIKKAQEKILNSRKNLILLSVEQQKQAFQLLQKYDFEQSATFLEKIEKKLQNETAKATIKERIDDMKMLEDLVSKINSQLRKKRHRNSRRELSEKKEDDDLRSLLPDFSATHILIKRWEKERLSIHIPYKFSKSYIGKKIELSKLSSSWVYENLIKNQWSYNEDDLLSVATFCFYYRMYDESWKHYKKYTQRGNKAQKLLKQLQLIEKEAEQKYEEEYMPVLLKLRKLIKMKKRKQLEDAETLREARQKFRNMDRNYRYRYGKTLFFLKKSRG